IDAGGILRHIAEHHRPATLVVNQRQHLAAERVALAELRDGDVERGLDWYVQAGRVATFEDAAAARADLVEAWWAERTLGGEQLLMAERRVDVARLNQLARQLRAAAGDLDLGDVLRVGDRDFAVG